MLIILVSISLVSFALFVGLLVLYRHKIRLTFQNKAFEIENMRLQTLLETKAASHAETLQVLDYFQEQFNDKFKAVSQQALLDNQKNFFTLAENQLSNFMQVSQAELDKKEQKIAGSIAPVAEALSRIHHKIEVLEKDRATTAAQLNVQLTEMCATQKSLRDQTAHLAKAFGRPSSRGQWGEIQLRRVVELSGMIEHCDFVAQPTMDKMRPDMVIKLPGSKCVIVDAKAPMTGYLDAVDAMEEHIKAAKFSEHAKQVRLHIRSLSQKAYWEHLDATPEFVVMFLPSESFFSKALEYDHTLIEFGIREKIIMATPTTLIALLRTIHFAWQNERLSINAKEICRLGREMYTNMAHISGHFSKMGKSLEHSLTHYNKTVKYLEGHLLPTVEKLRDLRAFDVSEEIALQPVALVGSI